MQKIGKIQESLATIFMVLSCFGVFATVNYLWINDLFGNMVVIFFGLVFLMLFFCLFVTSYYIHKGLVFFLQVLQSVLIMTSVVSISIALVYPIAWIGYVIGGISTVGLIASYWKE